MTSQVLWDGTSLEGCFTPFATLYPGYLRAPPRLGRARDLKTGGRELLGRQQEMRWCSRCHASMDECPFMRSTIKIRDKFKKIVGLIYGHSSKQACRQWEQYRTSLRRPRSSRPPIVRSLLSLWAQNVCDEVLNVGRLCGHKKILIN